VWYRLNEKYGSEDIFWGRAEAFRPMTVDELAPTNPDASDKRIVVRVWEQTFSCFEGNTEVYFAPISSETLYDAWDNRVDAWETPFGDSLIWRKAISLPLSGGSGIGLTIASALVEARAGHIWVESVGTGQGSTFSFTIPASK
jgi:hypothetical protein